MSVEIISNGRNAVMSCTTSYWAFGPVFSPSKGYEAEQCAEFFVEWHKRKFGDVRQATEPEVGSRYLDFLGELDASPGQCYWCDKPIFPGEQWVRLNKSYDPQAHFECQQRRGDDDDLAKPPTDADCQAQGEEMDRMAETDV